MGPKYVVELAEEERVRLGPCCGVAASVRMVTRARVLLKADEGYTDGAIAAALEVATATVGRIRLVEEGLGNSRDRDSDGSSVGSKKPMCGMQYPA